MKKLLFVMFGFIAMTFAACGGCTTASETTNDSDSVAVDTLVVDSIDSVAVADSIVAE